MAAILSERAVVRHPCLVLFLTFSTGLGVSLRWHLPPEVVPWVGVFIWVVAAVFAVRGGTSATALCLVALVAVCGAIRGTLEVRAVADSDLSRFTDRDEALTVEGVVDGPVEPKDEGARFGLRVHSLASDDSVFTRDGGILVSCRDFQPDLNPGDRVRIRAQIRSPVRARNPGAFDYRDYLRGKGYDRTGNVRSPGDLKVIRSEASAIDRLVITPLRNHVRTCIRGNLSGAPAALVEGVLLGDKSRVPESVREDFSRSGVSHVLAVSGLHVGLVAGGAFFGTRMLGGGAFGCGVATTLTVWLYALITGLPASVVRAGCVACLVVWARACRLQISGLNALGLAGLVILVVRPLELTSLGFQLSFAATGGILLLHRPFTEMLSIWGGYRWRSWVATPLAVSIAAQLSTLPLIVSAFGQVSLIATAANLLVVPLMSGAVGIGLLTVLVSAVSEGAATILNGANWAALKSALWFAEVFSAPTWASVLVVTPPFRVLIVFVCALLVVVESVRCSRWCGLVVIAGLMAANLQVWGTMLVTPKLVVRVIDVGQGDGILISFPNGRQMLVDGGIAGFGDDAGERAVIPLLRHFGISKLDAVVASHPHADHVGGLVTILDRIPVDHYLESGQYYGSSTAGRIRRLISGRGVGHHVVAAGDSLVGFGDASVVVLHPRPEFVNREGPAPEGLNNGSVVMKVTYRGRSLLLTGDIEHETDAALLSWGERLTSTVLKSAHHGSKTSSTFRFLEAVQPEWIAISCGVDNKFGHPSPAVLDRYRRVGSHVRRTDLSGCLTYEIDEDGVTVRGHLD